MPHLEPYYADKLRGARGRGEADAVLDLAAATAEQALAAIDALLAQEPPPDGLTVAITLAPPPEGGGETLFQPVGRRLLEARRRGAVAALQTLPAEDGLGFLVAIPGRPAGR